MTVGRVFKNLLLIKPLVYMGVPLIKDDLFSNEYFTQPELEKYFNHLLKRTSSENGYDYSTIRELFISSLNEMSDVSGKGNYFVGNSISYRDFIRLEVEDEEARELFNPEVKKGSFNDIEKQFNEHGKKLEKYFMGRKDSELHPFITSETGVNRKQFTQFCGFVGLKPDMDGTVIPVIVEDNFYNGLNCLENYFINCKGTRKALTTNNRMTKRSGYLTRKLSLSNIDHYHDNSIKDCGTKHFVIFNVDSEKKLNQIIGRHYYELDENNKKISDDLYTVIPEAKNLIGKKIGLRSPITCCGKKVCATCYGRRLSEINKDVNTGLVAVNKLTEPLTQRLLSAKHCVTCC